MNSVAFINNVPQQRFCSTLNKPFSFSCKCYWVLMDSGCAYHPYNTFINSGHSGSLAVRHLEPHSSALLSRLSEDFHRIQPPTLFDLSAVIWTQIRGHLDGSLQCDRVNVFRHVCNTCCYNLLPMTLNTMWQEMGDQI